MTIYRGERTIDGVVVTADGAPLAERADLKRFTDRGFEWTYEGAAPAQLALALLADHTATIRARLRCARRSCAPSSPISRTSGK